MEPSEPQPPHDGVRRVRRSKPTFLTFEESHEPRRIPGTSSGADAAGVAGRDRAPQSGLPSPGARRPDPPPPRPQPRRPAPVAVRRRHREALLALVSLVGTGSASAVALISDLRAFEAVATPFLYLWLALCGLSTLGVLIITYVPKRPGRIPAYFRLALLAGAVGGLAVLPDAWRVITKVEAGAARVHPAGPLDLHDQRVSDRDYIDTDLRHADLRLAVLTDVRLSGANLAEADLRQAVLTNVDLAGANLCGTDLRGADLRGARHLTAVESWAYAFYDEHTQLPESVDFIELTGAIADTGRGCSTCARRTRRAG